MSSGYVDSHGVGFGYATTLVQLHLGIGLLLLIFAAVVNSIPALHRQAGGGACETGLKAAAAAAGPAPVLAAFALIQGTGAQPDLLTSVGLLISTAALVLGSLYAFSCCCLGFPTPLVNARTGWLHGLAQPGHDECPRMAKCFEVAARLLNCLRTFGQALLLFSSLPQGFQLLCGSVVARTALAVHSLAAGTSVLAQVLGAGALTELQDTEKVVAVAPLICSLAVLDQSAFGPSSVLAAALSPCLHLLLAVMVLLGLLVAVRASHNHKGAGDAPEQVSDMPQLGSSAVPAAQRLWRLLVVHLHVALAAGSARILSGTIALSLSTAKFSVEWGDPLLATAALLMALLVAVKITDMVLSRKATDMAEAVLEAAAQTNGCESSAANLEASSQHPLVMDRIAAAVVPAQSLLLALLVAQTSAAQSSASGLEPSTLELAAVLLQHGLVPAAFAVAFEAATVAGSVLLPGAESPGSGLAPLHLAARLGRLGLMLGLLLGWTGLGVRLWLLILLVFGPWLYLLLPQGSREACRESFSILGELFKDTGDYLSSRMQAYMKQRQRQKEVQHARKADAMAAEVERELGTGPGEKGSKAPKGLKVKGTTAPVEAKVNKPKGASKPRRR